MERWSGPIDENGRVTVPPNLLAHLRSTVEGDGPLYLMTEPGPRFLELMSEASFYSARKEQDPRPASQSRGGSRPCACHRFRGSRPWTATASMPSRRSRDRKPKRTSTSSESVR